MNGLYFIPIFSVVLAGFLFKRTDARAANIALILGCSLLIRTSDGNPPERIVANHKAHHLSGASVHYTDPAGFADRQTKMESIAVDLARDGHQSWIIPAGASDALGMLGMADAMIELGSQLFEAGISAPTIWHASSSAGTTAGFAWGAHEAGMNVHLVAVSVGDPIDELRGYVEGLLAAGVKKFGGSPPDLEIEYRDDFIGEGYSIIDDGQRPIEAEATAKTGLLFDPTYTGKALYGLYQEIQRGRWGPDDDVIFWHTGGGFAALY